MDQGRIFLNKYYVGSLYIIAILFLSLYFILSYNARIAGDDFYYLWLKNTYGSWNGMMFQYKQWSGRWTAHFIGCELISLWKNPFFLPFINLLTIGILFFSLKIGLEKIMLSLSITVKKYTTSALTFLLITTFFFTSYSIGETWFWYIIILTYLWSIILFLLLIILVFSKKSTALTYILIVISSLYIGGASESFALIFIILILFALIYYKKLKHEKPLNKIGTKLLIAFIILSISFLFSAFAPGTEIRQSFLPQTSLIGKFFIFSKTYFKYFIHYIPDNLFYLILFSFPWLYFGSNYLKNAFTVFEIKKHIKKTTIIFLILLALFFFPTSFILSETGPGRSLSIISILTAIYFAIIFSLIGVFLDLNKWHIRNAFLGISMVSISVMIYNIYSQFNISKKFSNAYEERLLKIETAKENNFTGVLELQKLPHEGMLFWDELSTDTSYFTNKHLKAGLELTFEIKLKSE